MVNYLISSETAPEAWPEADREQSISLREQVDGEILGVQKEETRAKIKLGQENTRSVLEAIGFPPGQYTPEILADWIAADPNMLSNVPWETMSQDQKTLLTYLLWGCLGRGEFTIYKADDRGAVGHSKTAERITLPPSVTRVLRERTIFDPSTFADDKNEDRLQVLALSYHLREYPLEAAEWIERCRTEGRQKLAEHAIWEVMREGMDREQLRHLFPWFPFRGDTKNWSAADFERQFEEDERAARAYDAYQEKHGGGRLPNKRRGFDERDEEAEMDRPPYCTHPLLNVQQGGPPPFGKPQPLESFEKAVALARFIEKNLETVSTDPDAPTEQNPFEDPPKKGYKAALPALVANILATVESHPRESIPPDVLAFLEQHLSEPAVSRSGRLRPWKIFGEATGKQPDFSPEKYFCNEHELDALKKVLPKNLDEEWTATKRRDPLLIKTIVVWVQKGGPYSVRTREDFNRTKEQLIEEYGRRLREDFSVTGDADVRPNLEALGSILWMTCQKHLSIEDAAVLAENFNYTNARALAHQVIMERPDKNPDTGWIVWQAMAREKDPTELAEFLTRRRTLMQSSFAADPARAASLIEQDVIAPLTEQVQNTGLYAATTGLLQATNILARFDAAEARGIFERLMQNDTFRLTLHDLLQRHDHRKTMKLLSQLCYSELAYPRLQQTNYRDATEGKDSKDFPPALAWALDQESRSGAAWTVRTVPALNEQALAERWLQVVGKFDYPPPPPHKPGEASNECGEGCKGGNGKAEKERPQTMKDMRDALLNNLDDDQEHELGADNDDGPSLPTAPNQSPEPRKVGELSEELHGDARYLLTKICDDFDPQWLAQLPLQKDQNMDLRPLLHRPVDDARTVNLQMRMGYGAVVPFSMGGELKTITPAQGKARWAGHWSKRIDTDAPTDVTIEYAVGSDKPAGDQTLPEILEKLPLSLRTNLDALKQASDLPPELQVMLQSIDTSVLPLRQVVQQVTAFVHRYYEYCFILKNPVYKQRYQMLLEGMPYNTDQNEYLSFIHSLREDGEDVLGRGVCGQLSTVLESALRSIGVPAYFAVGYCPSGKTITTNDRHAWVMVPFLDPAGNILFKPVEATNGGISGLDEARAENLSEMKCDLKKAERDPDKPKPTTPAATDAVQNETEELREHFQGILGPDVTVSSDDIRIVDTLIEEAAHPHPQPEPGQTRTKTASTTSDRWSRQGYVFSPKIRSRLSALAEERADALTPAAKRVIEYVIEDRARAYEEWHAKADPQLNSEAADFWEEK